MLERGRQAVTALVLAAVAFGAAGAIRCAAAGESPFALGVHAGLAAARAGEDVPVAIVFDIPEHHKVYADTVKIGPVPGSGVRVADISIPKSKELPDPITGEATRVYTGRAVFRASVLAPEPKGGAISLTLRVRFQGCSDTVCFVPETRDLVLALPLAAEGTTPAPANRELFAEAEEAAGARGRNPFLAILFAFGFGLLVAYTPCVYPLIPVTAAVIGARGGGWRRGLALSLLYVLGLSMTYAALGAAAAKGGRAFGAASQHWAVATTVGLVFLALAASLFGVYDMELPASWQARLKVRRGGGPLGVLAMGALSGLVASPCVAGPVMAVLLEVSRTESVPLGAAMLFAMAWGMSALLILAGTFSGFAGRLPKAGGWMLAVKTGLGVILVGAALYYLRPVLPAWAFTAYLAAPLMAFGLWRGAWQRTTLGAPRGKVALRAAAIAALVFGIYFGVGAAIGYGMPAPLLSGLYPDRIVPTRSKIEFREDYARALAEARATRRPVMVDFVLPNCPGCRQLEDNVFSRDDVSSEAERFVRVRVDLSDPPLPVEDLKKEYRIFGAPAVVWIDGSGGVRYDLTVADGGTEPEEFLRRMREVR